MAGGFIRKNDRSLECVLTDIIPPKDRKPGVRSLFSHLNIIGHDGWIGKKLQIFQIMIYIVDNRMLYPRKDENNIAGFYRDRLPLNLRHPKSNSAPKTFRQRLFSTTMIPKDEKLLRENSCWPQAVNNLGDRGEGSATGHPASIHKQSMPGNKVRCCAGKIDGGTNKIFGSGHSTQGDTTDYPL